MLLDSVDGGTAPKLYNGIQNRGVMLNAKNAINRKILVNIRPMYSITRWRYNEVPALVI